MTVVKRRHLNNLNNNPNCIIFPADKGNGTVNLNAIKFIQEKNNLLEFSEYRTNKKDHSTYLEQKTKSSINSSRLSQDFKKFSIVGENCSCIPQIYDLSKIHKSTYRQRLWITQSEPRQISSQKTSTYSLNFIIICQNLIPIIKN